MINPTYNYNFKDFMAILSNSDYADYSVVIEHSVYINNKDGSRGVNTGHVENPKTLTDFKEQFILYRYENNAEYQSGLTVHVSGGRIYEKSFFNNREYIYGFYIDGNTIHIDEIITRLNRY